MRCVYKERNNNECGKEQACKGCKNNPNDKTPLTYDEFRNEQTFLSCYGCDYFKAKADMEGVKSTCKRLDHKHYCFSKNPYLSYDCGQQNECICSEFKPKNNCVWLSNHWNDNYIKEYISQISPKGLISLCIDHDFSLRYKIRAIDFVNGTFLNEDGSLKWIAKCYCKQSRNSPIGYMCYSEYPDGTVMRGDYVDWSKVKN